MNDSLSIALLLSLGMFLQMVLVLRRKLFSKEIFVSAIIGAAFGLMVYQRLFVKNNQTNGGLQLLTITVFMVVTIGFVMKDVLMPRISERTVLQLLIVAIYVNIVHVGNFLNDEAMLIIFVMCAIPLMLLFFTKIQLSPFWQAVVYIWVLLTSAYISWRQFNSDLLAPLFTRTPRFIVPIVSSPLDNETAVVLILSGMSIFTIILFTSYVLALTPFLKSKHQTWAQRNQEIKEHLNEMVKRYEEDDQLKRSEALIVIVLQGGLLVANELLHIVSPTLAIAISFLIAQLVLYRVVDFSGLFKLLLGMGVRK